MGQAAARLLADLKPQFAATQAQHRFKLGVALKAFFLGKGGKSAGGPSGQQSGTLPLDDDAASA